MNFYRNVNCVKSYFFILILSIVIIFLYPQDVFGAFNKDEICDLTAKVDFYKVYQRDGMQEFARNLGGIKYDDYKEFDINSFALKKTMFSSIAAVFKLPEEVSGHTYLALKTFSLDFEVYAGAEKIYTYNGTNSGDGNVSGYAYHIIHIPEITNNDNIIVGFRSVFSHNGSFITDLKIGNKNEIDAYVSREISNVAKSEIYYIILASLFIFIGLVLVLFFMTKHEKEFAFIYLGLSSVMIGGWVLFENNIISIFFQNKYATFIAASICIELMPIGFLGFVDEVFNNCKSVINRWLRRALPVFAFATFILDISNVISLYTTIKVFHIILIIIIIIIIYEVARAHKKDIKEAKTYLAAFGILSICGIADVLNMFYISMPFSSSVHLTPWAMLVFILLLIMILYKRIEGINLQLLAYNKQINEKNLELKKAWEEIKVSRDEIAEWNKTLERKVCERTVQLENSNEELVAMNEELVATMNALKEAQVQMIQSEKMASLGNLVAGIAHEINTPLGTIKSNIQMQVMLLEALNVHEIDSVNMYKQNVTSMNFITTDALERIIDIVKNLRNFARLDEAELKAVNIHDGLDSTLALVNHQLSGRIEIVKKYGVIPPVVCYPGQLNQLFLNLIVNAINAIEDVDRQGQIIIKTENDRDKVRITIKDTGSGISKKNITKIFDPGFTTKSVGVGTGLGLSICYRIAQKHNGTITVESEENVGTTFTVMLPLSWDMTA